MYVSLHISQKNWDECTKLTLISPVSACFTKTHPRHVTSHGKNANHGCKDAAGSSFLSSLFSFFLTDRNATKGRETRCHGNMETCQSPPYISANTDVIGLMCKNEMYDFLSNIFRQKIK